MRLDPSHFHHVSITDTCSVWNLLSSGILYSAAMSAGCIFPCTRYVIYECLHKPRSEMRVADGELRKRLQKEIGLGRFQQFPVSVEGLQDPAVLAIRDKLGKGEVSVIAFAKETGQAMMTDDGGARHYAERHISLDRVQTTPKLFGWLLYTNLLTDGDKEAIIAEHESLRSTMPLTKYLNEMYRWALQCRLQSGSACSGASTSEDATIK